ncbi:hypothetical protein CspeluHIS016_0107380 [Cutaneotrichosporon spelunceum]|uniref:Uncharacterized protein n=1 Tax=Cutaneotrichosporon spelunceum TaxID=1672016 RepID=A0AAD3TP40_9TREE|nr:hypothetical protein CspeluHIS016_0107380 [Cutaneotrichosporon spelunceum]
MPATDDDDDDYGDELVYDSELDETLRAAEAVPDIEDAAHAIAPFDEFRHRGNLSVSDLVGPVWCEVQFDYRLRTFPYLPVSKRPTTITSTKGATIHVDQTKVEGKERILKRGETIHKRLEREIHPEEVRVQATTREDTWGLRMLNMFSALEALLTIGKCRELPVAGFVDDMFVLGIIDEITRVPIAESPTKGRQARAKRTESGHQASLNDFFGGKPLPRPQSHRLLVSDSKTRATASMPKEDDTLAGRLQVMLYKELLDALLVPREPRRSPSEVRVEVEVEGGEADAEPPAKPPEAFLPTSSEQGSGLWRIWDHLGLDTDAWFTEEFIAQTRPVVESNELRFGVGQGRTLAEYARSWTRYVAALGLGAGTGEGCTDTTLELVYRRAAPRKKKEAPRKRRKGTRGRRKERSEAILPVPPPLDAADMATLDEETQVQLALQLSMQDSHAERETNRCSMNVRRQLLEWEALFLPQTAMERMRRKSKPWIQIRKALQCRQIRPHRALPWAWEDPLCLIPGSREQEREDAALAWAVEMSLGTGSQETAVPSGVGVMSSPERRPRTRSPSPDATSGSIIGKHRFPHDPDALGAHLQSVLQYWRGTREPQGVSTAHVRRCHWCEFEEESKPGRPTRLNATALRESLEYGAAYLAYRVVITICTGTMYFYNSVDGDL